LRTPSHLAGEHLGCSGATALTNVAGAPVLWQPRMEPALANRTTHLQWHCGEPAIRKRKPCSLLFSCQGLACMPHARPPRPWAGGSGVPSAAPFAVATKQIHQQRCSRNNEGAPKHRPASVGQRRDTRSACPANQYMCYQNNSYLHLLHKGQRPIPRPRQKKIGKPVSAQRQAETLCLALTKVQQPTGT